MVNHDGEEWEWKGKKYICKPGQKVTSLEKIRLQCGKGISTQNIRTALKRFEKLGFLTSESTNESRLITVLNWELYQGDNKQLTSKLTGSQQAPNKRLTTNKNIKNDKNDKEDNILSENFSKDVKTIVDYLNQKAGASYRSSSSKTRDLIKARFNEGFTVDDFKKVIDNKVNDWLNNDKMNKYLRPETLFGTKFESYLNEKGGNNIETTGSSYTTDYSNYDFTKQEDL